MQRVRLVLPYLKECGVEAEILCVEPAQVAAPLDAWLEAGLPKDVPVHRVRALSLKWSKIPGLGTLGLRAVRSLKRCGDALLAQKRFDLVYFSTTVFGIHSLGPRWKRKFGVPFTMDYQDPWVTNYYAEHPEVTPPGGKLKYGVVDWLARRQEPLVLRECSGITSVSPSYPKDLNERYPWLQVVDSTSNTEGANLDFGKSKILSSVLPFPGDDRDFERVRADETRQSVFDPSDGLRHWVYVGVCPPSMLFALKALFHALRKCRDTGAGNLADVRLHFIGTSYAPAGQGQPIVAPLAEEFGLTDKVHESTDRIPYSEVLRCLTDADSLLVLGSDDPGYTASKIYPYLLAEKPLLAVFHEQSSVVGLLKKVGGGTMITFDQQTRPQALAKSIHLEAFDDDGHIRLTPLNRTAFAPHTARYQATQLVDFWQRSANYAAR